MHLVLIISIKEFQFKTVFKYNTDLHNLKSSQTLVDLKFQGLFGVELQCKYIHKLETLGATFRTVHILIRFLYERPEVSNLLECCIMSFSHIILFSNTV